MENILQYVKNEKVQQLSEMVDLGELVEIYAQLQKHNLDEALAADLVVSEAMAMALEESTEPVCLAVMEASTPVLMEHVLTRSK